MWCHFLGFTALVLSVTKSESKTIVEVAEDVGATTFLNYANKTGLLGNLTDDGPYTVFIPSNDAFTNIPENEQGDMDNLDNAKSILLYHIVRHKFLKRDMQNERTLSSESVSPSDEKKMKVRINVYQDGEEVYETSYTKKAFKPRTVSIRLLSGICKLEGQWNIAKIQPHLGNHAVITASGSPITSFDHQASNGVVHILTRVMILPPSFGPVGQLTFLPICRYMMYGLLDGGLMKEMTSKGPFTLFAPTDVAFEQLPNRTLQILHQNVTAIRRVMENHIVNGTYFSMGMYEDQTFTTQFGETISVHLLPGNVTVDGAFLLIPDFTATNGVVHFTSKVFVPPGIGLL